MVLQGNVCCRWWSVGKQQEQEQEREQGWEQGRVVQHRVNGSRRALAHSCYHEQLLNTPPRAECSRPTTQLVAHAVEIRLKPLVLSVAAFRCSGVMVGHGTHIPCVPSLFDKVLSALTWGCIWCACVVALYAPMLSSE
jgi:hypothetical protein